MVKGKSKAPLLKSTTNLRMVFANPWRTLVVVGVIIGVAYGGSQAYKYSEASSLEGLAKADCGVYGVRVSPGKAECIADKVLVPYHHWGSGQDHYLKQLWTRESGWNWYAINRQSGAYGIPQSLPAGKMASVGCIHETYHTNVTCQMHWGTDYIKSRYGSPRNAWNHELRYGWY